MKRWTKQLLAIALAFCSIAFAQNVSAESINENKEEVATRISSLEKEMNQLLDEIDAANQEVSDLEKEIQSNTKDMDKTKSQIAAQEKVVAKRLENARTQLQALQTSEVNHNVISTLLEAKSISDFFQRVYSVTLLTDASQEHLMNAKEEQQKLEELKAHLDQTVTALASKKAEAKAKEADLSKKVGTLKEDLSENKSLLASLNQKEAAKAKSEKSQTASSSANTASESSSATSSSASGEWMNFQSTGYSTQEAGLSATTATGINLHNNPRVIAVDPSVIPLGSVVEVEGMGTYVAGDTGSAIHGHIIDIHFSNLGDAYAWGRRSVRIRIVG